VGAQRVLVIVNEAARGGAATLLADVVQRCLTLGYETDTLSPRSRESAPSETATAVAAGDPRNAVIAVGGDGTVRAVAEGLARGLARLPSEMGEDGAPSAVASPPTGRTPSSGTPALFIVPGGTGNSVYRALWEDRPWSDALEDALSGRCRIRDLDLLRISETGSFALLGASAGLIAETVHVAAGLTGVSGRDLYQAAALAAVEQHVPFPANVAVNGTPLHEGLTTLVAVGGARHRSGTFQLLPRSVLDDGLLDVCVIEGVGAESFMELAGAVASGEHIGRPEVSYAQGRSVTIERTDGAPLRFEHDGDLWPRDDRTITIESVPGAVPVLAPVQPVAG